MDSVTLDDLDRQLLHALQLDGRAPFSRIASVLGVADRTLARRYARLREVGAVRVLGVATTGWTGDAHWFVRLRCLPDRAMAIARALARRSDTSWVTLLSGGSEVVFLLRGPERLLLDQLGRWPGLASVEAQRMLRAFMDEENCWRGRISALTPDQVARLRPDYPARPSELPYSALDGRLLSALAHDGRAAFPALARSVGWSESVVRRRLAELRRARALQFSIETDVRLFGYGVECMLWLQVAPGRLTEVGRTLSGDVEVAFVAAVTGSANLMAFVVCRDADVLYEYLADRVGAMAGLQSMEALPISGYSKRIGPPTAGPAV
ncbi:Lrp/AsnC family transcriptional regulator [Nonomuraea sediminis]|uniref:Lrp/AsnC family transcriptional regulator n=1 Tax=Nonomuraea sediminis TaxID=2835864 RepID=UPI001BDC192B|nr:AsnC family transcriptional regulator [Nonomuraea sediminis]